MSDKNTIARLLLDQGRNPSLFDRLAHTTHTGQSVSEYRPSLRDSIARLMMGDGPPSPARERFVGGLMGSTGLGNQQFGVADVTPLGALFGLNESIRQRDAQGAALAMLPMAGARYYRRTNSPSPDTGVGYMMFSNDADKIGHYGKNLFELRADDLSKTAITSADDPAFMREAYRALRRSGHDRAEAKSLTREAYPEKIVNSAGLWDDPASVQTIWERVLEPKGITTVFTPDGAVTFDPAPVRKVRK